MYVYFYGIKNIYIYKTRHVIPVVEPMHSPSTTGVRDSQRGRGTDWPSTNWDAAAAKNGSRAGKVQGERWRLCEKGRNFEISMFLFFFNGVLGVFVSVFGNFGRVFGFFLGFFFGVVL